jgi:UDP-N-acetylglucosamine 2-epimerase (non-hydrolysing)
VLVLRDITERPEGVEAGVAQLVGTDADVIVAAASKVLGADRPRAPIPNPYGDGRAAERIVATLRARS